MVFPIGRTRSFFQEYMNVRDKLSGLKKWVRSDVDIQTIDYLLGNLKKSKNDLRVSCGGLFCYASHAVQRGVNKAISHIDYYNNRPIILRKRPRKNIPRGEDY